MSLCKKIKKENGTKEFYFLGVKLFSYQKKKKSKKIRVGNNTLIYNGKKVSRIPGLNIHFNGENAKVIIKGKVQFEKSFFEVKNNTSITIEESEHIIRLHAYLGENTQLSLGRNFSSSGLEIHAGDAWNSIIQIGEDCLCSWNVEIWASDGHTIFDPKTKKCLNIPKEVIIGDHVWLCKGVTILKNTTIPEHCIVARNAVVSGSKFSNTGESDSYCILGGTPAKVIKRNIDWDRRTTFNYLKDNPTLR